MLNTGRLGAAALAAGLLSGCQTPVIQSRSASAGAAGLVYALPKAQVQLDASRTVITADDVDKARKAVEAAGNGVKDATTAEAAAKAALKEAEALLAAGAAGVKPELTHKRDVADAVARVRSAQLEAAKLVQKEAAKRLGDLEGKVGSYEMSASLKLLPVVPDVSYRYVATLHSDPSRDDKVKLTTVNGMLSSGSSESTGQTAAILINLASALAAVKAPLSTRSFATQRMLPTQPDACAPFTTSLVFDPTDPAAVTAAMKTLATEADGALALEVTGMPPSASGVNTPPLPEPPVPGLFYRAPLPVVVRVRSRPEATGLCRVSTPPSSATLTATLPDSRSRFVLPVQGSAFTRTQHGFEFKDGMLISLNHEQPSQLAAISRIPVDILKAILEVPGSLLKLRVDYASQAAALTEADVKQLKAQLEQLNASKALKDAQPDEPQ